MKHFLFITALIFSSLSTFSQDIISFKDGKKQECNIDKVTEKEIEYHNFNNLSGPVFVVSLRNVQSYKFEKTNDEVVLIQSRKVVVSEKSMENTTPMKKTSPSSVHYKGYLELSYGNSPFEKNYGTSSKVKAAEIGNVSTSHGIIISNVVFIGVGGQYLKTFNSTAPDGFGGHGDLRFTLINGRSKLIIGGKGGYLKYNLVEKVYESTVQNGTLTTTGGLMINPFISTEMPLTKNNNFVISAGYLMQHYNVVWLKKSGLGTTLFNDDFEYFHFSLGATF